MSFPMKVLGIDDSHEHDGLNMLSNSAHLTIPWHPKGEFSAVVTQLRGPSAQSPQPWLLNLGPGALKMAAKDGCNLLFFGGTQEDNTILGRSP